MTFNRGFKCPEHGSMQKAGSKTIRKVKYDVCPQCDKVVSKWERPLNERPGHCGNCAYGGFISAIVKRHLLRYCKKCGEVVDLDDNNKVVRKGAKEHAYKN